MKTVSTILIAIALAGCMSSKTFSERMVVMQAGITVCQNIVLKIEEARANGKTVFTEERDQLIYAIVDRFMQKDQISTCDDIAIAAINSDAAVRSAVINGSFNVATFGLGVAGLASIGKNFEELGKAKGNTSIDRSRVISDSANSSPGAMTSASGTSNIVANVDSTDGSQSQGGIQPRNFQDGEGDVGNSPSQSGSDAPVAIAPADDPVVAPVSGDEAVVIQPVEVTPIIVPVTP